MLPPLRFNEDIVRDLIHVEEDVVVVGKEVRLSIACRRRAVWAMLCADDARIVSKSAERLAKMMAVIVTVFRKSRPHGI